MFALLLKKAPAMRGQSRFIIQFSTALTPF
nr:MAG TPA: hypothetical protein [Caudoviricetes sp.]